MQGIFFEFLKLILSYFLKVFVEETLHEKRFQYASLKNLCKKNKFLQNFFNLLRMV